MLRCGVCGEKQVCSVPITVSVVDAAADVLGVALVAVAVVGLALDDLRAAALAVGVVAALARPIFVVLLLVVGHGSGHENEAQGQHEE